MSITTHWRISSIIGTIWISKTCWIILNTTTYTVYCITRTAKRTCWTFVGSRTTLSNINSIWLTTSLRRKWKSGYITIISTAFISSCTQIKKIQGSSFTTCTQWILSTSKSTLRTFLITFCINSTICDHALITQYRNKKWHCQISIAAGHIIHIHWLHPIY